MATLTDERIAEDGQAQADIDGLLSGNAPFDGALPPPVVEEYFEVVLPKHKILYMHSPRLRYPEQAADFVMEMREILESDVR